MADNIRIAVIDSHPLYRDGVVQALRRAPNIDVVAEGATADDAVRLCRTRDLDLVLLDVRMNAAGIEALETLRRECPNVRLIMLTASEDPEHVVAALRSGASGYVLKGCDGSQLLQIVRTVRDGETYITPTLAMQLLARAKQSSIVLPDLSFRENQVLQLLSLGLMNREIAVELRLTEKTVKHYMTCLMQKLQVRNRVEAVLAARRTVVEVTRAERKTEPQA
jgi:two-component system nitrate/nitrite response regulator NarL